jgi:ABC-type xylose transport system permease subunit
LIVLNAFDRSRNTDNVVSLVILSFFIWQYHSIGVEQGELLNDVCEIHIDLHIGRMLYLFKKIMSVLCIIRASNLEQTNWSVVVEICSCARFVYGDYLGWISWGKKVAVIV